MATKNYNSETDDYQTPEIIYKTILDFINRKEFDCDVCASERNIPANNYNGIWLDGLKLDWYHTNFMNPPWSQTPKWIEKAFSEVSKNECEVWCVLPGDRLNMVYFNKTLRENNNWFIAVIEKNSKQKINFINPHVSDEKNQENINNGGFGKAVFIMYIGHSASEYSKRWRTEQPLTSLVLVPVQTEKDLSQQLSLI